mmetsp:Transcript_45210/g.137075  ORF Transcript_45210/g.137075 Transcript_45210/m.137075 type:complete len:201 (+) Transcript_45210:395-997(+)
MIRRVNVAAEVTRPDFRRVRRVLLFHGLGLVQALLGSRKLLAQDAQLGGVPRAARFGDPVPREQLLEETPQLRRGLEILGDPGHKHGAGPRHLHAVQPVPAMLHELLLLAVCDSRHRVDDAPHDSAVDNVQPTPRLDVPSREIAHVVFPSGMAAEEAMHRAKNEEHRKADNRADLHADHGEVKQHGTVQTHCLDVLLLRG